MIQNELELSVWRVVDSHIFRGRCGHSPKNETVNELFDTRQLTSQQSNENDHSNSASWNCYSNCKQMKNE